MTEEKFYNVKNLKTGYIYNLRKNDCDRLITEEPDNFEIVDKDYVKPVKKTDEKTVYEQVIVDNELPAIAINKSIAEYTYAELKKYCKENNLSTSGNTEVLRERILKFEAEKAE